MEGVTRIDIGVFHSIPAGTHSSNSWRDPLPAWRFLRSDVVDKQTQLTLLGDGAFDPAGDS